MKKVNGFTIYEENDKCALDEYSAQLEKDITQKFKDEKFDDTEIKQKILDIQEEQTEQNTKIEENNNEIKALKEENKKLKQENTDLKNTLPCRRGKWRKRNVRRQCRHGVQEAWNFGKYVAGDEKWKEYF